MSRLKTKEAEFVAQLNTMISGMNASVLTAAGITPAQWDVVENTTPVLVQSITEAATARAAAKTAVAQKDALRQTLRTTVQGYVDRIYAAPTVTDVQLAALGLPPRSGFVVPTLPRTVTALEGKILPNSSIALTWRRSGNSRSTLFEVQVNTGTGWTVLATQIAVRWTDETTPAGVQRAYRIVAVNPRGRALPSPEVSFFSEENGLFLAAA